MYAGGTFRKGGTMIITENQLDEWVRGKLETHRV